MHLCNIRSIKKNLKNYTAKTLREDIDIIVCTETWLYKDQEEAVNIDGYNSYFKSNNANRAGGVAVFVRSDIASHELHTVEILDCDCCFVEINVENVRIQVAAVYRSPSAVVSDQARFARDGVRTITNSMDRAADCVILGDMNMCLLSPNREAQSYLDEVAEAGFLCLNEHVPTRITENGQSLIDHVLLRQRRLTGHSIDVSDSGGVSDHEIIELRLPLGIAERESGQTLGLVRDPAHL